MYNLLVLTFFFCKNKWKEGIAKSSSNYILGAKISLAGKPHTNSELGPLKGVVTLLASQSKDECSIFKLIAFWQTPLSKNWKTSQMCCNLIYSYLVDLKLKDHWILMGPWKFSGCSYGNISFRTNIKMTKFIFVSWLPIFLSYFRNLVTYCLTFYYEKFQTYTKWRQQFNGTPSPQTDNQKHFAII